MPFHNQIVILREPVGSEIKGLRKVPLNRFRVQDVRKGAISEPISKSMVLRLLLGEIEFNPSAYRWTNIPYSVAATWVKIGSDYTVTV